MAGSKVQRRPARNCRCSHACVHYHHRKSQTTSHDEPTSLTAYTLICWELSKFFNKKASQDPRKRFQKIVSMNIKLAYSVIALGGFFNPWGAKLNALEGETAQTFTTGIALHPTIITPHLNINKKIPQLDVAIRVGKASRPQNKKTNSLRICPSQNQDKRTAFDNIP